MIDRTHPTPEELMDYVHHELDERRDAAVHAHVAECSDCREAYEAEVRLGDMLRAHARSEERDMPYGLAERIFAAAAADHERPLPWWQRLELVLRPAIAIPAAGVLVLGVFFAYSATHRGAARATAIDAAYYLEDHAALAASVPFEGGSVVPATLTSDDAMADERTVDAP